MRLLLIRHGETVDNVAGNFAGVTDSALTAHGVLQAQRLAAHLVSRFPDPGAVRAIVTSDLQRAWRTGAAIQAAYPAAAAFSAPLPPPPYHPVRPAPLTRTTLLRERDFRSLEGTPFRSVKVNIEDVAESMASVRRRAQRFVDEVVLAEVMRVPDGRGVRSDDVLMVVAHGLLLPEIYACLAASVTRGGGVLTIEPAVARRRPRAPCLVPWWSNTGYLECALVRDRSGRVASINVLLVNSTLHLADLRRTGGGIGSAAHDDKQKKIESYFGGKKL